jgi:aldose 1-epimerase
VRLRLVSPAGQNGFPGTLDTRVTFSVGRDGTLRLDYRATTDAATVLNLTHHLYLNLAGAGSGSIDPQWIRILADRYTSLDADRLPTGVVAPVADTPFDLRAWTRIGPRLRSSDSQIASARGFDHNFVLRAGTGVGLGVAACAYDPASGRVLIVRTDQPGVQFYTANGFDGALRGEGGRMLRQGDGFALETQHFADSPRHANFPSTVLRPGQTFASSTSFAFTAAMPGSGGKPPHLPDCG